MVVIRLARQGRSKYPVYRIVAADSRRPATGKFIAILGHYNPHTKELVVKHDETKRYLGNGAQPSNTVAKLLVRDKVELPEWVKVTTKTRAPKKEAPAAEAPAAKAEDEAEVTAEEAEADAIEAPAEEVVTAEPEAKEATDAAEAQSEEAEERVAEVATEEAADNAPKAETIDHTDTAADDEQAAEEAESADEAAAEAATDTADAE